MTKPNDWDNGNLLGRVKTVHVEVATLSYKLEQWLEGSRVPIRTTTFNERGFITKELIYSADGNISQIGSTEYDLEGNKIEVIFRNRNGGLVSLLRCENDQSGRRIGSTLTSTPGLIIKQNCVPVYDHNGMKVEETWCYEDGTCGRKYTYRYDPGGQLQEEVLHKFADDGSLEEKQSSIYDEKGRIIETSCVDALGQPLGGRFRYKYDERGNESEVVSYNIDGSPYSVVTYSYNLDLSGNWVSKKELHKTTASGFETQTVTYRILEYY